jgi:2-polyprenyl-3-methyl-5-hydroxy-6-metoxy-1,4-benzoquinol methylase
MEPNSSAALKLETARRLAAEASGGTSSNAIYAAILRALVEFNARGKALDFGAGTGSLTRQLTASARFAEVTAADLMARPAGLNAGWIEADLNDPLPVAGESFDTVIAAEVIEHLENPRAMARELFRLLIPGGIAVVSTPNNESWRSLLSLWLRGHHIAFLDGSYPAHITALVRRDLHRILIEAGFEAPQFRFSDNGGIPGMPTTSWQQASFGALRGLRFSDNLIAIACKPASQKPIPQNFGAS